MFTKNIQLAWLSRISIAVTSGRINQNYGSIYSIGRNWPSRHKRMSDETSCIPSPRMRYPAKLGCQPIIMSVLRHQGLRRLFADLGICSPAAHICMGPSYLSLPVSSPYANSNIQLTKELVRGDQDSLSPYQGTVFKPFGLHGWARIVGTIHPIETHELEANHQPSIALTNHKTGADRKLDREHLLRHERHGR